MLGHPLHSASPGVSCLSILQIYWRHCLLPCRDFVKRLLAFDRQGVIPIRFLHLAEHDADSPLPRALRMRLQLGPSEALRSLAAYVSCAGLECLYRDYPILPRKSPPSSPNKVQYPCESPRRCSAGTCAFAVVTRAMNRSGRNPLPVLCGLPPLVVGFHPQRWGYCCSSGRYMRSLLLRFRMLLIQ
jgi:hypothetical protein